MMDFFYKHKQILLIAGFIAVVLMMGFLIFNLFFKSAAPIATENQPISTTTAFGFPISPEGNNQTIPQEENGGLPVENPPASQANPTASGGLTKTEPITQTNGLDATLSGNGSDLQYYNKDDGKFYRVTKDGKATELSDKTFYDVQNVIWSPDKNKAILEYPDDSNILYDFNGSKQVTLPSHWKDFGFSADGRQIVMKSIGTDENNRWLAIANSDGSKARRVEALGDKDDTVYPSWSPNNQEIAMYTEGTGFDTQEVYFVGLNHENFKSMTVEGRGFIPEWSPKGDRLLYSVYSSQNDLKPSLWIANAQGENIGTGRMNLNIGTWADKCVFADSVNLYCAVPENLEAGAGLFPEMGDNTTDRLYKIDTSSGLKKMVAVPDGDYTMSDLIVSNDGQYLYFTDKKTGNLNKIQLK